MTTENTSNKAEEINDDLNTAENSEQTTDETEQTEAPKSEPTAEEKYAELNDRFMRLYAEFDNFRRRTNKEKIDLISTANAAVLKEMIPILDDFERAIANNDNNDDPDSIKEGFHLIYNKTKHALESKGLKPMVSKGEVFDSELHEAIANVPAPTPKDKGKVIDDVEKGYYLNDKVVRFAKVVVGQ